MIDYSTAKTYVDQGWSVFPVNLTKPESGKIEKKPAVPWKDYMTRLPTDQELHQWFDTPQYNGLGLATGKISHVIVIDVDSDQIPEGFTLESTIVAKTISGGRHYYYDWDEELRNDVKIQGLPIDFRGDGGYVVLPPSEVASDMKYEWMANDPTFTLKPLPGAIKDLLRQRKSGVSNPIIPTPGSIVRSIGYGDDIPDFYTPAQLGERNNRATEAAGKIAAGLQPYQWEEFGWPRLVEWNRINDPPLPERELRITWQSVCGMRARQLESETPQQEPIENVCQIFTGQEATDEYTKLQTQYGMGLSTGYDELDFFFKFMPEQLYLISAATHVGKSTLALNMCGRIASLGHEVLFCSLEQGIFIEPRVKTMLGGPFPEKLSILISDKMLTVDQLVQVIEKSEHKPELICIDHINFLRRKGVGATEDMDEIILQIQNMAKHLQKPVLVISHVRKLNQDRRPTMDDLKDSSSLSQVPAVVMFIYRGASSRIDGILLDEGEIVIAKNRIQGKTGRRNFLLKPSGEILVKDQKGTLESRTVEQMDEEEIMGNFQQTLT